MSLPLSETPGYCYVVTHPETDRVVGVFATMRLAWDSVEASHRDTPLGYRVVTPAAIAMTCLAFGNDIARIEKQFIGTSVLTLML